MKNFIFVILFFVALLNSCCENVEEVALNEGDLMSRWIEGLNLRAKENGAIYEKESFEFLKSLNSEFEIQDIGGGSDMGVSFRDYQLDFKVGGSFAVSVIGKIEELDGFSRLRVSSLYISKVEGVPEKFTF